MSAAAEMSATGAYGAAHGVAATLAALCSSIGRCCDVRGDDDRNRAELVAEAALLPPHLQIDAREHFDSEAAIWIAASGSAVSSCDRRNDRGNE